MTYHLLPPLPYEYSALEPWVDAQTMRTHHDYHHQKWVDELNNVQAHIDELWKSGDSVLIGHLQEQVALALSEHLLHRLFWEIMGPNQGGQPRGALSEQIVEDFGSFANFKSRFSAVANSSETGGWVILAWQPWNRQLGIVDARRQRLHAGSEDRAVLLVLDVWEHAYYLKYQHRRAEYVHNWWNVVNWPGVGERFIGAAGELSSRGNDRRRKAREGTAPWSERRLGGSLQGHSDRSR